MRSDGSGGNDTVRPPTSDPVTVADDESWDIGGDIYVDSSAPPAATSSTSNTWGGGATNGSSQWTGGIAGGTSGLSASSSGSQQEPRPMPAEEPSGLVVLHIALDVGGMLPGVGIVPDAINTIIYLFEGDWENAAWSAGAMVPIGGQFVTVIKWGRNGYRATSGLMDSARTVGRMCSFTGETTVLMADGEHKPIEDIEVGDMVIATDPETGEQTPKEVPR